MQKVILLLLIGLFTVSIQAQTPTSTPAPAGSGIKANLATGEVISVSQSNDKLLLKTTDGNIDVLLGSTTSYKKVAADNPSLKTATDSTLSEIGEGDKILVTGVVSADKKSVPAKVIYLMTKSDISKKIAAERELWRTRGIFGRVVSVDFKTKNVTLAVRGMMGENNVVLSPKDDAEFLRYAPDSIKFSDAVESNLAEIKVGDQLRALGDKSADGLSFKAEKYISGSFKTLAGKVTAIDIEKNEITIEDSQNKKPVVVVIKANTLLKKFPPEQAQMMAAMMSRGGMQGGGQGNQTFTMTRPGSGQGNPTAGQNPPANPPNSNGQPTATPGGQPQVFRQRGGGEDMIDNLPNLAIAELKVGDTIGISTTANSTPNRYTAIKLVSGVEPFLNIPQPPAMGGNRGSQSPSITIPGLDGGFGNP